MRLARRALFAALATLILLSAVTAQTLRPGNDRRNQAPTVGTGGTPGGPTGLFTIYDGDTLRKGEFTFSIAYSNYDRDLGNADITVIPFSVNVGLSDHLELSFSTEGYRGVKVNNPKNLSSFYLPNSQLFFCAGTLGSGPAPTDVRLSATATDPDGDTLLYTYLTTGGDIGDIGVVGASATAFGHSWLAVADANTGGDTSSEAQGLPTSRTGRLVFVTYPC
jgi:hypothetical protein